MLTNPVLVSVLVMCVLCLVKVNILLAIMISAVVAGLMSGFTLGDTMGFLIKGMGGNSETALSYILLGALAVGIAQTGLATIDYLWRRRRHDSLSLASWPAVGMKIPAAGLLPDLPNGIMEKNQVLKTLGERIWKYNL